MKEKLEYFLENTDFRKFINENKDMLIKVTMAALLVIVSFFLFLSGNDEKNGENAADTKITVESSEKILTIKVDIGGEVLNPMVAELEDGSRIEDAIEAAGGVTENADLTEINRAAFVEDGEKILIPSKVSSTSSNEQSYENFEYSDSRININTAGSEELQTLNGIGPVTAEKIIDYRTEHGRFDTIEDIKNVSGIGEKTFEKFKDDIRT